VCSSSHAVVGKTCPDVTQNPWSAHRTLVPDRAATRHDLPGYGARVAAPTPTSGPSAPGVDLAAPAVLRDPFPTYRALRELGPVVWLPEHRAWFVSTYDEVNAAFRDTTTLTSDRLTPIWGRLDPGRRALLDQTFELLRGWMVFHDPPDHDRLREPLRRAFTPKRVADLRPHVEALVDELLDDLEEAGDGADLKNHLAFPLPAIVIAELLGVPPADRDEFRTWSNQLAVVVFGATSQLDLAELAAAGSARFADYFDWLIRRYTDEPEDNLVSALIAVTRDDGATGLTASELVGTCTLLLFGGHETTTGLISLSTHSLLTHPDQHRWLQEHPGAVSEAAEELHRFDGTSKVAVRVVAEPHERGGQQLEPGQPVFLGAGGANRDPAAFPDPDRLWLGRPDAHRHLGFGYGIHFCLGAPLARLETSIALGRLVQRFPRLRLAVDPTELTWGGTLLGRGLGSLPVAFS
jgi:cytochrome P450